MAPINVEIMGNKTYTAQNNEKGGINYQFTDLGIVYSGTEDGGRVIIAHKKDYLEPIEARQLIPKQNKKDNYDKEIIEIKKGQEPIEKEVELTRINGKKDKTRVKISAF